MRKTLISLSALALSAGMASAGGMVVPTEPVIAAPAPLAAYDWAGAYAGLGLSYGRASYDAPSSDLIPETLTGNDFWPSGSGLGIGGLVGFNWQSGGMVYGIEGHASANRMRGNTTVDLGEGDEGRIRSDVRSLASLRGRIGVAQDRTLFFLTAGPAIGSVRHSADIVNPEGDVEASVSDSNSVNGVVIGAGIEHALTQGWHVRGDIEHYRFGRKTFSTGVPNDFPDVRTRVNLVRISAVFRF